MARAQNVDVQEIDLSTQRDPSQPEKFRVTGSRLSILRAEDAVEIRKGSPSGPRIPVRQDTFDISDVVNLYVSNPPSQRLDATLLMVGHNGEIFSDKTPKPVHPLPRYIFGVENVGSGLAGERGSVELVLDDRVVLYVEHLQVRSDTAGDVEIFRRGNNLNGALNAGVNVTRSTYVADNPLCPPGTRDDNSGITSQAGFLEDVAAGETVELTDAVKGMPIYPDASSAVAEQFSVVGPAAAQFDVWIAWREVPRRRLETPKVWE